MSCCFQYTWDGDMKMADEDNYKSTYYPAGK